MMRSPNHVAIAVRKPDGRIVIRNLPFRSITSRVPFFKKPVLRGVVTLIESMVQGFEALGWSANVAGQGEQEELSKGAIAGSILTAFAFAIGLFVALPHALTVWIGSSPSLGFTVQSPVFHLIDGTLKMGVLLAYVHLIGRMKDIHRVFQYHGAEHKSIYAFESGEELTVENARRHSPLHPRCGTSFLLFLVLISIGVFSMVLPLLGLKSHLAAIGLKTLLMLPVAGLSYEFIKACACRMENPVFKAFVWPGLMLQKLTTREPDDQQLEVALASLRQAIRLEKAQAPAGDEVEIAALGELAMVAASVAEFPEG